MVVVDKAKKGNLPAKKMLKSLDVFSLDSTEMMASTQAGGGLPYISTEVASELSQTLEP